MAFSRRGARMAETGCGAVQLEAASGVSGANQLNRTQLIYATAIHLPQILPPRSI